MIMAELQVDFQKIEDMLVLIIERLERTKLGADENVTKLYWTLVKMQNHRHVFPKAQIQKAEHLMKAMEQTVTVYNQMLNHLKQILAGFTTMKQQVASGDAEQLEQLQKEVKSGRLYEQINWCMQTGQDCLEQQKNILADMKGLDQELEQRARSGHFHNFYQTVKEKFAEVLMRG